MTFLILTTDADFDWLCGEARSDRGLKLPPGGVERPETLPIIRAMAQRLRAADYPGSWMMVADGEVVGLCNFVRPPADGVLEVGYGVAVNRRDRGHATAAVAAMLAKAGTDPANKCVYAETSVTNPASARALEKNGFLAKGRRDDPEDGELIQWKVVLDR